jgi:hypothetical protein
MKIKGLVIAFLGLLLVVGCALASAQSLGDLARQQREQRQKEAKQPVKVFTNDNLPARPPSEGPTAASSISAEPGAPAETEPGQEPGQPSAEPSQPSQPQPGEESPEDKMKTREYWQGAFSSARQLVARAEEEQRLVEDEISLLKIQQAQELSPDIQSEVGTKLTAKATELADARAKTAKAKKALEDLETKFKESGAPEDWSKTE